MAISALTLSSVDEQIKLLGVAPQIVPQLQQLLVDVNTNPDAIMNLIKLDSALAARVIKTSNSAFFSPGFEVCNIEDAVTYLGYDEVYRILSILAFAKIMRTPLEAFGLAAGEMWRRALCCALGMEALAKTHEFDRRTAYTIGLLHSVGMVFVNQQLKNIRSLPVEPPETEDEVKLLGLTHAEVGAYVLRKWNFPENIAEPVRSQFDPLDSTMHGDAACLLNTAKCLTLTVTQRRSDGESPPTPDPVVLTMLGITDEDYAEVLEETEGKFVLLEIANSDF